MITQESLGVLYINNIPNYEPFLITYTELDVDTVQVDIYGTGCINYFGNIDADIEIEINTNINKQLREYADLTGHNSADIGYTLNLKQSKKLNRRYNTFETSIESSIIFNKPVIRAKVFELQPTIELITSILLDEIFILKHTC